MKPNELIEYLKLCNPEHDVTVSIDVSTGEDNSDARIFANVIECIYNDPSEVILISEATTSNCRIKDNRIKELEAEVASYREELDHEREQFAITLSTEMG